MNHKAENGHCIQRQDAEDHADDSAERDPPVMRKLQHERGDESEDPTEDEEHGEQKRNEQRSRYGVFQQHQPDDDIEDANQEQQHYMPGAARHDGSRQLHDAGNESAAPSTITEAIVAIPSAHMQYRPTRMSAIPTARYQPQSLWAPCNGIGYVCKSLHEPLLFLKR